ncbi:helix-turn-helix domain-containing protein [Dyella acidiphila]|uniref:Helix-turn-helix domain-containing protein n=1 Tax=Dyella acidiphila TaxID=2775866 RepID=A0ABR9GBW7_9GAMM|nr:helix-turn-helix domain-containing protein [Dyella acidiphila]MBE1161499.1 helix-turn-helix domain-containing protein [Dyella acidiphila]
MTKPIDTDGILRRMRQLYAAKNDSELALALGLSISAVSNWRQRNSPPFAICAHIACKNDISLDWLIFDIGTMKLGVPAKVQKDARHPGADVSVQRISEFVTWWSIHRSRDELIWLEQQIRRAVPEYGEWLVCPSDTEG